MLPVFGREVVKGQERLAVLDQAGDRLVVLTTQVSTKASNATSASLFALGHLRTLAVMCTQQRCPRVVIPLRGACQKPRQPSATARERSRLLQHVGAACGALVLDQGWTLGRHP